MRILSSICAFWLLNIPSWLFGIMLVLIGVNSNQDNTVPVKEIMRKQENE